MDPAPQRLICPACNVRYEHGQFCAKDGTPLLGPLPNNTIWQGFGGVCETQNSGDPTVNYDRFADRWVIAQMAIDPINFGFAECVAVSTTGDPTGSYARYAFVQNALPDYPKMGGVAGCQATQHGQKCGSVG